MTVVLGFNTSITLTLIWGQELMLECVVSNPAQNVYIPVDQAREFCHNTGTITNCSASVWVRMPGRW
jgi:hypothetical protein